IGCAMVLIQAVVTAGQLSKLIHQLLNQFWKSQIKFIDRFATLEIHIRVLCSTPQHWAVWAHGQCAMCMQGLWRDHCMQHTVIASVKLPNLVGGTESTKKVQYLQADL